MSETRKSTAVWLFAISAALSAVLAVGMFAVYLAYDSKLVFAQAADSAADMFTGAALLWAVRISMKPADDNHPFGHHSAQAIAALVVAVLACVLAIEVARDAIVALIDGAAPTFNWLLVEVLGAKVLLKALLAGAASRHGGTAAASALRAFQVDARNDVAVGAASIVGVLAAGSLGMPLLDAWLALPVAGWVGYSGVSLTLESASILLGESASDERLVALMASAADLPDVDAVDALRARRVGEHLHVWVEVHVDPTLTIGAAHDIGERVEATLLAQDDVAEAVVHVDATVAGEGS